MIRLLLLPVLAVVLLLALVVVLADRSDDQPPVRVASTSQTTVAPLEPAHTTGPGVTMPEPKRPKHSDKRARSAPMPVDHVGADVWWRLAMCETGGTMDQRATSRTGRYLGYFQFDLGSWRQAGGTGDPRDHGYEVQRAVAQRWQQMVGWGAWPHCSRKLGLA